MGIQVGGRLFSYNRTIKMPDEDGTMATQEYVGSHSGGGGSSDIEITDFTKGVILTAPNATRWRITINNSGALVTTQL